MKRIYSFLAKLSLCFLICCKSVPISTERNPTLLVGEIVFLGNNYSSNNGISFNGVTTSGIDIVLKNTITNEIFRFSSDENGLFYINLQEGKYLIDELYLKKERHDGAWASIYTNPSQKALEIERGKVNNVGIINWSYVDRKHKIVQTDDSVTVKNLFSKQYPTSNWNQKEWKYNLLSSGIINNSGETVTYYLKSNEGRDSTRFTLPKDMPVEVRRQIEMEAIKRLNAIHAQGDTTYYIKSENGLDSAFLKIPKGLPEDEKQRMEEHMKSQLRERE